MAWSKTTKISIFLCSMGITAGMVGMDLWGITLRINTTDSMPKGLYVLRPMPIEELTRDTVIGLCVPEGYASVLRDRDTLKKSKECLSGLAPLMKPIAGVPTDLVEIDTSVSINHRPVPMSFIQHYDSKSRPMHPLQGWVKRLETGEVFVLSTRVPNSLDSRYFGTIRSENILGQVTPLLIWESEPKQVKE